MLNSRRLEKKIIREEKEQENGEVDEEGFW